MSDYVPPPDLDRKTLPKLREVLTKVYPGATFELTECAGTNFLDVCYEGKDIVIEYDRNGKRSWGFTRCDDQEIHPFDMGHDEYLEAGSTVEAVLEKLIAMRQRPKPDKTR